MKKIVSIIIIVILLFVGAVVGPISEKISYHHLSLRLNNRTEFITYYDDSSKVLIKLDINGISYGQELLWKANTTGTNYEESVVTYTNDIAYIGSCSTHGAGHDKIFAVNTRAMAKLSGTMIQDLDTSVQSLTEILYISEAVPMGTILRMNTCMRLTG